jgi:hypothetical protein
VPILPVQKTLWPGTDDDDLPETSRLAARGERTLWRLLLQAWETVATHVNLQDLIEAVRRGSDLDADRHLLPDLSSHLMREILEPRLDTMMRHGIDHEATALRALGVPVKQLEVSLQRPYREAARWAQEHAGALITEIRREQQEVVARLIARANRQGLDPEEVARRLRRTIGLRTDQEEAAARFRARLERSGVSLDDLDRRELRYREALQRQRTRLIARTELIRSVNAGQQILWDEAVRAGGLPRGMMKRWVTTPDERLCPRCEALGEHAPIPVTAEFSPGVMHPGLHPNCRCAMALVPPAQGVLYAVSPNAEYGQLASEHLTFDGRMRQVARLSEDFWGGVSDTFLDRPLGTPGTVEWWDAKRQVVTEGVQMMARDLMDVGAIGVDPYHRAFFWYGQYFPERNTVAFSKEISENLFQLFTASNPKKLLQTSNSHYLGFKVALHELLHVESIGKLGMFRYMGTNQQFLEEGLTELRSRRLAATLIFHGETVAVRRAAALRMTKTLGQNPYDYFVAEMRWYEMRFGTVALEDFVGASFARRTATAARALRQYVEQYAKRSYGPEAAARVRAMMQRASDEAVVGAWKLGHWQAMDKSPLMGQQRFLWNVWGSLTDGGFST